MSIKTDINQDDIATVTAKHSPGSVVEVEQAEGAVDSEGIGYGPSITIHLRDRSIRYRHESSLTGWEVVSVRHH
tara:strand:+ start:996 stop:1217 length:222 start_codon:yes stop_codon:yes gene_type:complete